MANIGTWLGDVAHSKLISGAASDLVGHMSTGAMAGAAYGAGSSFINNTGTPINDAVHGAITGAVLGAGTRYAAARYATGMHAAISDVATNGIKVGTERAAGRTDFSLNYFTAPVNKATSFYNVDGQVMGDLSSKSFKGNYKSGMQAPAGGYGANSPFSKAGNWTNPGQGVEVYK